MTFKAWGWILSGFSLCCAILMWGEDSVSREGVPAARPAHAPPPVPAWTFSEYNWVSGLSGTVGVLKDPETGDEYIVVAASYGIAVVPRITQTKAGNPAEREQ